MEIAANANLHRNPKTRAQPFLPKDFMIDFDKEELDEETEQPKIIETAQSWQEKKQIAMMWAALQNSKRVIK